MRSFLRARDLAATAPHAPAGPVGAGCLASRHGQGADGPTRMARMESRGRALVRWTALAFLLAVAGRAATSRPLAASARQAMSPWCAAAPAALTDDAPASRTAPARQGAEPVAQAGFGWG